MTQVAKLGVVVAMALVTACGGTAKPAPEDASGEATSASEQPIPDDLKAAVERSELIGGQLYVLDKVAAIATDALLAQVPNPEQQNIGGYLPLQEADEQGRPTAAYQVPFFTREQPPRIAYRVHVAPNGPARVDAVQPPTAADEGIAALIRSRQAAIAALPSPQQPINPVLIPAEAYGEQGTLVYLLAGTKQPHVAVFGQHFLALVPTGADKVTFIKPLSKSILEVPMRDPGNGETLAALMVSHLVTDYPLETHVFTSKLIKLPVFVVTRRGSWRVADGKISFLRERKAG